MRERLDRLSAHEGLDVEASALLPGALNLSDATLLALIADVAAIMHDAERVQSVLAGVAAQRSRREHGHSGLAAGQGHATPSSLIQAITGGTKAEANRHVRVGTALFEEGSDGTEAAPAAGAGAEDAGDGPSAPASADAPWHAPLQDALLDGRLTSAQFDAIRRGLGEPCGDNAEHFADHATRAVREAWSLAALDLIDEAGSLAPEQLAKRARIVRDLLDPVGAEERFAKRFESRSYRMWVDADGQRRGNIAFDDEMGLWMQSMFDAALRPRRGGPRFVSDEERRQAEELIADPRTNEQLAYDLLVDVLRAGALAEAPDVFGVRQPGVRMVVVKDSVGPRDPLGRLLAVGHAEEDGTVLAGSTVDRNLCAHGSVDVTVDRHGNPLDMGRELRLYSTRQRVALAVRDGGCIWPGCDRPPSCCEAHHCDHFGEHGGHTDIDRGVLLCRFHHMLLHNRGWRISREGQGPLILHPPPGGGPPIVLKSQAAWKWAWDPPPDRAGWRAAS
ncbi:MAG TPA: DUF222 domain-containing protein [Agromyces sp.]